VSITLTSCSFNDSSDDKSVEIIKLNEALSNTKPININDISTSLEYVPLETKDECLTGTRLYVYSTENYLIAIDREKIFLFNRKDGKFIRQIGHKGNGPGEYSRTYIVMPFNEEKNIVYAGRNKKRYGYSFDGQVKDTLSIPELVSEIGDIDDNVFAAFIPDYQGGEKRKIVLFNNEDSLLKTYPNYLSAPQSQGFFVWNPNSWFYRLNKQLHFFQLFNDTVFKVGKDFITPEYAFDMGQYSPPYEMKTLENFKPADYFITKLILESSKYLFCSFNFNNQNYTAFYDKSKKQTIVNDYSPEAGHGFINTNDFVPLELSSVNDRDELTCTINAFEIKQWFDKNPEKIDRLPGNLKALKDISETGNPVVVIAKLRNE
jgi:hypothetical protein